MGWVSATGAIQHVHRRLLTSPLQHLRCLDPPAEIRLDRPLPDESSQTTGSLDFVCPSCQAICTSIWGNPFRVSEVGSAARAAKVYGEWLVTQKDLLRQLPRLDRKRLLCHCNKSSPSHVDSRITIWRSHRSPLSSQLR